MGNQWHERMADAGVPMSLWRRYRAVVAAQLPAPCTVCHDLVEPHHTWHLEHRSPLAAGGPAFDPTNLGPAHAACNLRKGSATPTPTPHAVRPSRNW